MCLIKTRYEEIKIINSSRACHVVVMDTNLIGYKAANGMDTAKHAELLPTIFSSNSAGSLVRTDYPTNRYDTKKNNKIHEHVNVSRHNGMLEILPCHNNNTYRGNNGIMIVLAWEHQNIIIT